MKLFARRSARPAADGYSVIDVNGSSFTVSNYDQTNALLKSYSLLKEGISIEKIQPNEEFILEWEDDADLEEFAILRR